MYGKDITIRERARDSFQMNRCMICGSRQSLSVRLKPLTAGVRILSIDGGGIKGIVPLQILKILQTYLGSDSPIQELFDLVMGTSAGK